jgi:tetratricopeptide (TPR) repeat protein
MARRTAETIDQALLEFQRAVELDPQFALAWVGVAEAAQLALNLSDMKRPETQAISSEAIENALSINDQLGEAHLAHAELLRISRAPEEEREAAYKLAIELSPGYARAWERYSDFVDDDPDRLDEALELAKKAVELDPLSPAMQQQLIYVLNELGQSQEAQEKLLRLIEQDPDFAKSYEQMSDFKYTEGQFAQAIVWLRRAQRLDPGNLRYVMREMFPQMRIGNTAELDRLLKRMENMDPSGSTLPFMEVMINIYKKNYDAALEASNLYQQRTAFRPGSGFGMILVQSMRNEPAAAREAAEVALPRYFKPAEWDKALEFRPSIACHMAWILSRTDDGQNGQALALKAIEAYRNEPSWRSEQVSDFFPALCYMVTDQPEEALQTIEEHTRNGQTERWWMALYHPAYQLLRNEPRFIAAEEQTRRFNAGQRELLAKLQAEEEE